MRIAIAQLNSTVGDLSGNRTAVRLAAERAVQENADLLVTPELFISGYPPKDLLLRDGFVAACDRAVDELAKEIDPSIAVLVGHPTVRNVSGGRAANAASLLFDGAVQETVWKTLLPNYDVFDERRYFEANQNVSPMKFQGRYLGVHICEDAWWKQPHTFHHYEPQSCFDPVQMLLDGGADILINLSASPFEATKPHRRTDILLSHVRRHHVPFLFVNQVGGNDDLVFDGRSQIFSGAGESLVQLAGFREDFCVVDWGESVSLFDSNPMSVSRPVAGTADATSATALSCSENQTGSENETVPRESDLLDALILGLGDYMRKCGFSDCVLGLSGGIDSAVAAYIAAKAVGPEHVHGILMPSRYSSQHSVDDALQLANNLGIDQTVIPIDSIHRSYEKADVVCDDLTHSAGGLADQNLQARIRGALVMVRSNQHGWIALATGNKSELAVGYCTLYGDMAGGFAVLADLLKRDVYGIARYINTVREGREVIPNNIITKAPSAELAPDQFDQDVLPPYEILDGILEGLIEREESVATLSQQFPAETVRWVVERVDRNEFKRRQMPPGIKLSSRAFGSGRRMPMAAKIETT